VHVATRRNERVVGRPSVNSRLIRQFSLRTRHAEKDRLSWANGEIREIRSSLAASITDSRIRFRELPTEHPATRMSRSFPR